MECGFTQKRVRDMTRTYNQMHRTDKYSEHSSIIWPVWPNDWVFVYELSSSGFEPGCNVCLSLLKSVADWFVTIKILKGLDNTICHNNDTASFNADSDIVRSC